MNLILQAFYSEALTYTYKVYLFNEELYFVWILVLLFEMGLFFNYKFLISYHNYQQCQNPTITQQARPKK